MRIFNKAKGLAVAAMILPGCLTAQQLRECPNVPVSQVEEHRLFANGAIYFEVAQIYLEPSCCTKVLIVRYPNGAGGQSCQALYRDGDLGYGYLLLSEAEASYDPALGLTVAVPGLIVLEDLSFQNATQLFLTINQATGRLTVNQKLGPG